MPCTSRNLVAAMIWLMGCAPRGNNLTEAQRAAIGDSVRQVWAEMMAGAQALDPARVRAGYMAKPTVAINGVIVQDFAARLEDMSRWLGSLRRLDANYDNVHLEVLGPDAAIATMNHHLRWTDTAGSDGEWHSAWTALFRRIDGNWKIAYSHESIPVPE